MDFKAFFHSKVPHVTVYQIYGNYDDIHKEFDFVQTMAAIGPDLNQTWSQVSVCRGNKLLLKQIDGVIPLVAMAMRYQILKNKVVQRI